MADLDPSLLILHKTQKYDTILKPWGSPNRAEIKISFHSPSRIKLAVRN